MTRERHPKAANAQAVADFKFVNEDAALINLVINLMQETDTQGRMTRAFDKTTGRMVLSIRESLDLEEFQVNDTQLQEQYGIYPLSGAQLSWIQDRINELFQKAVMPYWGLRPAFRMLEWEVQEGGDPSAV